MRVEINDHKGEPREYEVTPLEPLPWATGRAEYHRLDSGDRYTVQRNGKVWHCTCPDFFFRWRRASGTCKHLAHWRGCLPTSEGPTVSNAPTQTAAKCASAKDAEFTERPAAHPLATMPPNGLAGKPTLAGALVRAVLQCKAVPHDATNAHHKYAYTSAEAIIEEARAALAANGLGLIPVSQSVNGHEREGPDRYELVQERLLIHTGGESLLCRSAWPIVPGNGRPLDKATAAADTLSLAYFLRDLLQMPRVDPADDVAGRDDSGHTQQKPAQKAARPAQPKPDEKIGNERAAPLIRLLNETGTPRADVLERFHIKELADLPAEHLSNVTTSLQAKLKVQQQVKALVKERALDWADVNAEIASRFDGKTKLTDLALPQLRQLVGMLEDMAPPGSRSGVEQEEEVGA